MAPRLPTIFSERQRQAELMDRADLDFAEHACALRGLARINTFSRSSAIIWPAIEALARASGGSLIRVLDVATGGGDVPIALTKQAARAATNVEIDGCDISGAAVSYARLRAREAGASVRFFELDVLREPIPQGYDVITCSLFLHHLDEHDACSFLRKAAGATGRVLLVNDLVRGSAGYVLAWAGCRILSRSAIVHHDGPVSVAGAFTVDEARALAHDAGLSGARITRHWPRRFLLSWSR